MKDEDLEPFAVAEGLIAKMGEPSWRLSETEQDYLMERARENLAREAGVTLQVAADAMGQALDEGDFAIQASKEFACVTMYRRLLYVVTRTELIGLCHPERN